MEFSKDEKKEFLKAFTDIMKEENGKGPQNIHIRYLLDEVHIIMYGVVSDFERHLIKHFGQEAIDVLTNFYERTSHITEKVFLTRINHKYDLRFHELESDFNNDLFVYKMKLYLEEEPSSFKWIDSSNN